MRKPFKSQIIEWLVYIVVAATIVLIFVAVLSNPQAFVDNMSTRQIKGHEYIVHGESIIHSESCPCKK